MRREFVSRRGRRTGLRRWLAAFLASLTVAVGAAGGMSSGSGATHSSARRFTRPTHITNRYLPLRPGTRFVLSGHTTEHGRRLTHRVVLIVSDVTKVIDGVRTLVTWDRDYQAGQLVEGELAFEAQDDAGNVWLYGEYPEVHVHGKIAGAPATWIAGIARARAGILMQNAPRAGTPSRLQGYAPAIDFADRAQVYGTNRRTCVPIRCYEHVLVIAEWDPTAPTARQFKYFAPGVGNIRVGYRGGDEGEALALVSVTHLNAKSLAGVREEVLTQDRRGYLLSKDVYAHTPPAEG